MCLHGLDESGQLHRVSRSAARPGKRGTPAAVKASSTPSGISPARSAAANAARAPITSATRRHCDPSRAGTRMLTWYGEGWEPWTRAPT